MQVALKLYFYFKQKNKKTKQKKLRIWFMENYMELIVNLHIFLHNITINNAKTTNTSIYHTSNKQQHFKTYSSLLESIFRVKTNCVYLLFNTKFCDKLVLCLYKPDKYKKTNDNMYNTIV